MKEKEMKNIKECSDGIISWALSVATDFHIAHNSSLKTDIVSTI